MLFFVFILFSLAAATPKPYNSRPYSNFVNIRQDSGIIASNTSVPQVDVGYSVYQGYSNATSDCDVYKGIRFAQAPIGSLRWQEPKAPLVDRETIMQATEYASQCPQSPDASYTLQPANQTGSSEDCLFLNVFSPNNAAGPLPVLVWIHGGGYGEGNGQQDLQYIINTNNNSFVGIAIQYRLGAFGFLSSDEVFRKGVVNAGIRDQMLALQWVQQYIHLFNGDPTRVTISGESAGGGSVMLHDMAYGGSLGTQLFSQSIAASPYLPMQYGYKDWIPSQAYYSFAAQVGCDTKLPYGANHTIPTFECLVNATSDVLINASATISQFGPYGTWAFLPVTDDIVIQSLPSKQLLNGPLNGLNALIGNNANEGPAFVPQDIVTEDDLLAWLHLTFPLFSDNDIAKLLYYYPITITAPANSAPLFATEGNSGPTALNQSSVGTGQQQRANNIYAETTFVCPSYWMAEGYSSATKAGGKSYKYQFSIPLALHGYDVAAYFDWPGTPPYSYDFAVAFQQIWGNFITTGNPSIANNVANGVTTGSAANGTNPTSTWPDFSISAPLQIDLNTTCGSQTYLEAFGLFGCGGPNSYNDFRLVNAYTWEGGRGTRCDFWRAMGESVPE